jgi:hypothetical protein
MGSYAAFCATQRDQQNARRIELEEAMRAFLQAWDSDHPKKIAASIYHAIAGMRDLVQPRDASGKDGAT